VRTGWTFCAVLLGFATLQCAIAAQPNLTVTLGGQSRSYQLSELLTHAARIDVQTDNSDEAYKRPMRYVAIPIEALLGDLGSDAQASVQFVALDGYAPVIAAKRLTGVGAARAYLAIEPSAGAWPPLAPGKPSAGPFYLVWRNASGAGISPSEWPYQIAAIRLQASLANRFPLIVPDKSAHKDVWAGFEAYGKQCLPCHTINRQGEAMMGPDLNLPMNPTEYFTESALKKLVRDPKSVRDWSASAMPGFDAGRLSEAALDSIIAYLKHMTGKKVTSQ
jgi:mono/diheme cytochrome c family protein